MQPRQYRPGDVLDDYCPRERRVTEHAIVAMVDEEIQRTRCVGCDAEHEFKHARVPAGRRKGATAALFSQVLDTMDGPARRVATPAVDDGSAAPAVTAGAPEPAAVAAAPTAAEATPPPPPDTEDRPFRRSLIRAQLPRPEGQPPPTRAIPEFTMHQPVNARGGRNGAPGRFRRRPGGGVDHGGPMRFGRDGRDGREGGSGHGGNTAGSGGGRRRRRKKH